MAQAIETIDQVIARLTDIIDGAKADASRLGYFAALYRTVTKIIRLGERGSIPHIIDLLL